MDHLRPPPRSVQSASVGFDRGGGCLLRGGLAGQSGNYAADSHVVCGNRKTSLDTTGLGVWPGVVLALCDDGGRGVAHLATSRLERGKATAALVCLSVSAQQSLEFAFLRRRESGMGHGRNPSPLACNFDDHPRFLAPLQIGGVVACSLSFMGVLCLRTQCGHLANESLGQALAGLRIGSRQIGCLFLTPCPPFARVLDDHEKGWYEKDRQERRGDHPTKYGGTQ